MTPTHDVNRPQEAPLDLVIIGGGPGGMSAALVAGRARLRTLVVNKESPRNAVTGASHGFLSRDGIHPLELLEVSKQQLRKYESVRYEVGGIASVRKTDGGFVLTTEDGRAIAAQRVIEATGYRDDTSRLEIPGFDAVYGRSVFPCPFCDGFEHADEALAIFGVDGIEHFVPVVGVWSGDLVVFTNGRPLPDEAKRALRARGVGVEEATITRLTSDQGRLRAVELSDGRSVERQAGFVADDFSVANTTFARDLGVGTTTNAWGMEVLDADASGQTSVAGLYVIGDARSGFGGLIGAANEGSACSSAIVHAVAAQRWAG